MQYLLLHQNDFFLHQTQEIIIPQYPTNPTKQGKIIITNLKKTTKMFLPILLCKILAKAMRTSTAHCGVNFKAFS